MARPPTRREILAGGLLVGVTGGALAIAYAQEDATFAVTDLTVPDSAPINTAFDVEATIENNDDTAATTPVTVEFADRVVAEEEREVSPDDGASIAASITPAGDEEGTQQVAVSTADGRATADVDVTNPDVAIQNPYEGIDWETVEHHKSEFHDHPAKWEEPHRMVDLYHGSGEDDVGNTLADGDEYTVYGVVDMGIDPICWPWTDLSRLEGEDRDPEELGVVAFPGAEIRHTVEHFLSIFSTATDEYHDRENRLDSIQSILESETGVPDPLAVIAHPERYYGDPDEDWDRYVEDFSTLSLDDGLLGIEALNHDSSNRGFGRGRQGMWDLTVWDHLLGEFMPDRPIWGFSVDDAGEFVIGEFVGVDIHWTELLLDPDSFDPTDQEGSRAAAHEAMRNGRFFGVERQPWDHDTEDPPTAPSIEAIEVGEETITITASDYDVIDWISDGRQFASGESVTVTAEEAPYVRAEVWAEDPDAVTITQPFGVVDPDGG